MQDAGYVGGLEMAEDAEEWTVWDGYPCGSIDNFISLSGASFQWRNARSSATR